MLGAAELSSRARGEYLPPRTPSQPSQGHNQGNERDDVTDVTGFLDEGGVGEDEALLNVKKMLGGEMV